MSGARAAPLDWSQDVLFSALSFSHFFRQRQTTSRGWSQGTRAYVLDMSPPSLDLARHFIFRSSQKLSALAPADEHFSHTHTHIQLGAVKERKSRLTLIAAQSFLCVRVQSAFFVCASGLASQHSAFIKRGIVCCQQGQYQFLDSQRWCF